MEPLSISTKATTKLANRSKNRAHAQSDGSTVQVPLHEGASVRTLTVSNPSKFIASIDKLLAPFRFILNITYHVTIKPILDIFMARFNKRVKTLSENAIFTPANKTVENLSTQFYSSEKALLNDLNLLIDQQFLKLKAFPAQFVESQFTQIQTKMTHWFLNTPQSLWTRMVNSMQSPVLSGWIFLKNFPEQYLKKRENKNGENEMLLESVSELSQQGQPKEAAISPKLNIPFFQWAKENAWLLKTKWRQSKDHWNRKENQRAE